MKVYKITKNGSRIPFLIALKIQDLEECEGDISYAEIGDEYKVKVINMSQRDIDALPDWDGF